MTLRRIQIILIFFSFWMLAIVVPTVSFAPGKWEAVEHRIAGSPPVLETFLGFLLTLAAIAFACLSGLFIWKMIGTIKRKDDQHDFYREPIPASPLVYIAIFIFLATTAGMVWWMGQPSGIPEQPGQSRHSPVSPPSSSPTPVAPPQGMSDHRFPGSETLEYLLAIALLGSLSWVAWRGLNYRPSKEEPKSPGNLGQIVARAAMDLESGKEPSDVVLQCYRDMCAIMAQKVAMQEEMTAREFAQRLQEAGVSHEEVFRLTKLFERVRYGRYSVGPEERAEAVALLKVIEKRYGKNIEAH